MPARAVISSFPMNSNRGRAILVSPPWEASDATTDTSEDEDTEDSDGGRIVLGHAFRMLVRRLIAEARRQESEVEVRLREINGRLFRAYTGINTLVARVNTLSRPSPARSNVIVREAQTFQQLRVEVERLANRV
ncbi:hypothetical protein JR316_0011644 [Psilocybe cubensis]|uniref:Uncharacterized protein n=3 Tax=Psilocybe cubensis TaxID=181762 RepID=A0A8H8CFT8_PSICU|nr:hypothetical protein JR316_0012543 [Psilocybe cubensis]XP_047743699.1 hypothetical protein JR316_0011644 [Psilocybe cubensis]KAH9475432.1 hypothetical protein JR316_0012543 [Psilocybe cubensis]KAH9476074.1 hypothetical protein JR316_0011644 [Psilocybe cubensis]